MTFQDKLKSIPVDVDYFSRARYKAERAAIRKERNYLEFNSGVQGALTSYNDPWISVSGGDNSIALTAVIGLRHVFTKNLFTIETKFSAKLGYNRMKVETQRLDADGKPMVDDNGNNIMDSEGVWFKNQDEFVVSVAPSFKMSGAEKGAPEELVHVSGLPRHLARYHLQKPQTQIPDRDQPLADRPERHLCRKRLDPQTAGGRKSRQ